MPIECIKIRPKLPWKQYRIILKKLLSRPPFESLWRNFGRKGRGKGRKREGMGKRGGKGNERQGKKGKWRGKEEKLWKGKKKTKNNRGKVWKWAKDPFSPLSCHYLKSLKFVWGVPKWKFLQGEKWKMGNFLTLTSPTFDCTPLTTHPDQNASK